MRKFASIELRAGAAAYESIMDAGLSPDMIKIMAGAAGGPKWIVLGHLDRFIFGEWFKGRKEPLHMISASIGAWRFASALAYEDPIKGLLEFKKGYFGQKYSAKPNRKEITAVIPQVMEGYINAETVPHILNHPYGHLHMLAVRSKGLLASEQKVLQGTGLVAAIVGNRISRQALQLFFRRTLFADPRGATDMFGLNDFPLDTIPVNPSNFKASLLATSAIPMVMEGIPEIPGAPQGMYRDGGLLDYHLTFPYQLNPEEIVFQPHFFERVKPSWFDKNIKSRRASAEQKKHVLMIYPSQEFIDTLPGGYVPDRTDFSDFPTEERIKRWEVAYAQCQRIADEFAELVLSNKIREKLKKW